MADQKISAMSAASALTGAEILPVVQSAANVGATTQQVVDAAMTTGLTRQALGSINTNTTIDWSAGSYATATITGALAFTFSNPAASGKACVAYLQLTNGGSATITWPVSVTWSGGTAPTLRASGVDLLRFYTQDGGTTWFGTSENDEPDTTSSPGGSSGQLQYNNSSAFGGAPLWREDANTVAQRNSTTTQVAYWYKTYTDTSNYERLALVPGAASGWMQIAAQTAGTGTDNINVAVTPAGTGGVGAHVPDSTSTGGNARGANAVDWQTSRTAANQVASGANAVIGGGGRNIASSSYATAGGGRLNSVSGNYSTIAGGDQNTSGVSGDYTTVGGGLFNSATDRSATVAGGEGNVASGQMSWVPGGTRATTRGLYGAGAYASGKRSADGDAQVMRQVVRRTTTDATPVNLATDGTPAATTVMVLPSDSVATVVATVTAVVNAAGVISMAGWEIKAVVKNDSSTMTLTGGTATAIGTADAALATATCALVVDGTRDSVEVQVTGVAATTIYWVAEVKIVQAL